MKTELLRIKWLCWFLQLLLVTCAAWLWVGCHQLSQGTKELRESSNSVTKHKVLTVLWRVPLFETHASAKPVAAEASDNPKLPKPQQGSGLVDQSFSIEVRRYGSPAVSPDGNRVFVGGVNGTFQGIDAQTGKTIWKKVTNSSFDSDPLVVNDMVIVGSADGLLYALRASDGQVIWEYKFSAAIEGRPVFAKDRVLAMTDTNNLVCLDAQKGDWRWNYKRDVPVGRFQVKGVATPLVVGDKVYAGFSDGYLVVLSLTDGHVLSMKNLSGKNERFTDVDVDPVLFGDYLVTGEFSRGLIALDTSGQNEVWVAKVDGPSSVVLQDKIIYASSSDSKVQALDASSGKLSWSFDAQKGELSRPIMAGAWLLVSSAVHSLMVLDPFKGELIQVFNPGKGATSPPIFSNNRVYWVSNGETLYCMELAR